MCEELFGDELDVTEETVDPFETDKSQVRQYRDWLHERNEKQLEILKKVESALEKIPPYQGWYPGGEEGARGVAVRHRGYRMLPRLLRVPTRGLMVQKMKEVRPPKCKEVADEGRPNPPTASCEVHARHAQAG